MAQNLLPFGYNILTVDEGWSWLASGPAGASIDAYGRHYPRVDAYPSAAGGAGFGPLAAAVRAQGLEFGVWTIRGIPKKAAALKLPIADSPFTADEAVRTDLDCGWNTYTHGCLRNESAGGGCVDAAHAYYASIARLYAAWGVSYVKLDCMFGAASGAGAYDDDIFAYTAAFKAVGITVSLSPGVGVTPYNISVLSAGGLAAVARVTNDLWDSWEDAPGGYPTGLKSKLSKAIEFAEGFAAADNLSTTPDMDMLPVGVIARDAVGPLLPSNLTRDEQTLLMTLWCATGAPLVIGARLPLDAGDTWTLALLTNARVLAVHNESYARRPIQPADAPPLQYAWTSTPRSGGGAYVSLFNAGDAPATVAVSLADTSLPAQGSFCAYDLWAAGAKVAGPLAAGGTLSMALRAHAAGSYLVAAC